MHDPELQLVVPAELAGGAPLGKILLALNNAHAAQLSWLEPGRLQYLVQHAFLARRIGNLDASCWRSIRMLRTTARISSGFARAIRALSMSTESWSQHRRAAAPAGFIRTCRTRRAGRASAGVLRGQHKPAEPGIGRVSCRLGICRGRNGNRLLWQPNGAIPVACAIEVYRDLNIWEGVIRGLDPRIHQSS
jgi:hypothetical protein